MKRVPHAVCLAASLFLASCGDNGGKPKVENEPVAPASESVPEAPIGVDPQPEASPSSDAVSGAESGKGEDAAASPAGREEGPPAVQAVATNTPPSAPPEVVAAVVRPASFARCQSCHTVDQGGRNGMGPNLFGVLGSKPGSKPGYTYSDAMTSSREVWTRASLSAFIASPRTAVPGTKMASAPVTDASDREDIINYLSSLR